MPFGAALKWLDDATGAWIEGSDGQLSGLNPVNGVQFDPANLVKDVAIDALPGAHVTGSTATARAKGTAKDLAAGRPDLARARVAGSMAAGKGREAVVEEAVERAGKGLIKKLGGRAATAALGGPVGTGLAIADTINDGKTLYSTALLVNTGKDLDGHLDTARQVRDNSIGLGSVPEPYSVTADQRFIDNPAEITQGTHQNPVWQEAKARAQAALESFNPLQGDFGVSEILWGR